jgi:hypothetical protein
MRLKKVENGQKFFKKLILALIGLKLGTTAAI